MRRAPRTRGRRGGRAQRNIRLRRGRRRRRCRRLGRRGCVRPGAARRGRSDVSGSHSRVSPAATSCRAKTTALPTAPARRCAGTRSNSGSSPAAHAAACAPNTGKTVGALHELHGRGPARVYFDRVRDAGASDEVDAVDADEAELLGRGRASVHARVHQRRIARRLRGCSRSTGSPPPRTRRRRPADATRRSGTARPPAATNTTEPGVPSTSSCR